jgi:hypothetical protein
MAKLTIIGLRDFFIEEWGHVPLVPNTVTRELSDFEMKLLLRKYPNNFKVYVEEVVTPDVTPEDEKMIDPPLNKMLSKSKKVKDNADNIE